MGYKSVREIRKGKVIDHGHVSKLMPLSTINTDMKPNPRIGMFVKCKHTGETGKIIEIADGAILIDDMQGNLKGSWVCGISIFHDHLEVIPPSDSREPFVEGPSLNSE